LAGLYDINSDFDALDSAGFFFNNSHGIGADVGLSGGNGPSIFPFYGLAVSGMYQFNDNHRFNIAVADGIPGDAERPSNIAARIEKGDGAFTIAQWSLSLQEQLWLLGYWQYTSGESLTELPTKRLNKGVYVRNETKIGATSIFFRIGLASDSFNKYSEFLGAGIVLDSPYSARTNDKVGLGFAYVGKGDKTIKIETNNDLNFESFELNVEISYMAVINDVLTLQPNIQFIKNPGASDISDALVTGIRFSISL
jgi:porin